MVGWRSIVYLTFFELFFGAVFNHQGKVGLTCRSANPAAQQHRPTGGLAAKPLFYHQGTEAPRV